MTPPRALSGNNALFLTPEAPVIGAGGGGLRSASLLAYLREHYRVQTASFSLPHHSKSLAARAWRNGWRFLRGAPPLLDRYAGHESQLDPILRDRFTVGVIEHFWCAPYARILRPHCEKLVLDLHNIESRLAGTHAGAVKGLESVMMSRFAAAYGRLEREWLPKFDLVLVTSEEDRRRIDHPHVHVYPNALPYIETPAAPESNGVIFSGNLEYHPNVEAVRWMRSEIWPRIRSGVNWRLIGRNPEAVAKLVSGDRRIELIGPVDDAVAALAEAMVCVVPLLSGSGTRFKILEAWAAARAVVSTTLGAEGLDARPGEHLLIADDPAGFAEAVDRLIGDADLRKKLGEAGRALYLERYTWPAAWRKLEGLF
jgi:glycosyltransferase involved in cell wall biosynthesis